MPAVDRYVNVQSLTRRVMCIEHLHRPRYKLSLETDARYWLLEPATTTRWSRVVSHFMNRFKYEGTVNLGAFNCYTEMRKD